VEDLDHAPIPSQHDQPGRPGADETGNAREETAQVPETLAVEVSELNSL
jgi:hypothetical protein